jgi:hypothetical protein
MCPCIGFSVSLRLRATRARSNYLRTRVPPSFALPPRDRYVQKTRSRTWLAGLSGAAAAKVARVLREYPEAAAYYGPLKHAADPHIRAVLGRAQ